MNIKLNIIAALLLVTVVPTTALSVTPGIQYLAVNYTNMTFSENGIDTEYNPTALIGRYGVNTTKYFSFEGRVGMGLSGDTQRLFFTDVTLDIDSMFGLYAIGHINIIPALSLYGVLGITQVKATVSAPELQSTDSESGFSYGIGTDISISEGTQINFEYTQYLDESNVDISALSIGLKFNF